ncbi:unnamed protein product, partial [Polarella glacialis]
AYDRILARTQAYEAAEKAAEETTYEHILARTEAHDADQQVADQAYLIGIWRGNYIYCKAAAAESARLNFTGCLELCKLVSGFCARAQQRWTVHDMLTPL